MKKIYVIYPFKINVLKTPLGKKASGITALVLLMLVSIAGASPFAYITNEDSKSVSIIDLSTNRVTASISVGSDPMGVAVSSGGARVYVGNANSNSISVIDTATNAAIATMPVGSSPEGIAVSPDEKILYVANHLSNTVSFLDTSTNSVKATVNAGKSPAGLAVSPDGKKVYVTNKGDNTVSVIDVGTKAISVTVPVGSSPEGVAVSPDGKRVYVVNSGGGSVSIIDATGNRVLAVVPVGKLPMGVAVAPDGKKVYVTNNDVYFSTVSVIDTINNTVTATIPVGSDPMGISFAPDGKKVYVAVHSSNSVSIIDTVSNTITATVLVGSGPCAFGQFTGNVSQPLVYPFANFSISATSAYNFISEPVKFTDLSKNASRWNWDFGDGANSTQQNPEHTYSAAGIYTVSLKVSNSNGTDSKLAKINVVPKNAPAPAYAYVTNFDINSISIINTANNNFTDIVPVGSGPEGLAASPDGTRVYVANLNYGGSGTVSVIDTALKRVTATVAIGYKYGPCGVAISPDSTKAYVTDRDINGVSVIDTAINTVIATVPVGATPMGIAANPAGKEVYVANHGSGSVSVIDAGTNLVTATVKVGSGPYGIAFNPAGTRAYVTNGASSTVSVIDTATHSVAATVPVNNSPFGVAVSPDGAKAYVANLDSNSVSVIDTAANTVIATVPVGTDPYGVSVTPDGTKVYVTNYDSKSVSVIDTATNKVTSTVTEILSPISFGQFIGPLPAQPLLPASNFSCNLTTGFAPFSVQFTELSKNTNEWSWDFGDGPGSKQPNTTHTYTKAGTHTVNLTVSNPNGTNSSSAKINVLALPEFSASPVSGKTPLSVSFTDQSIGSPGSWFWDFGDGTNSSEKNPVHVYSKAGQYPVILTLNETGTPNALTKSGYITVSNGFEPPVATFSASSLSGSAPFTVNFTDQSTDSPDSWKWIFGDGTSSTEQNPGHIFNKTGSYSVTLTAGNAYGTNTLTKFGYIVVSNVLKGPDANFSASPGAGSPPLNVSFTDRSTGVPTFLKWSFGDGNISNETNPAHAFNKSGLYSISLTASNVNGTNILTRNGYIPVSNVLDGPLADFSASPTSGNVPLTVSFTDRSTGSPTSWKWSFGDGSTSNVTNPVHIFNKSGLYSVTLTVSNANGSTALTKSAYIAVLNVSAAPVTDFSASPASGGLPFTVSFTDLSTGLPDSWKWNFGDGNTSNETNPSHTYSKKGLYPVALTTTNNWGSNTVQRAGFVNVSGNVSVLANPGNILPGTAFSADQTIGNVPYTVSFTDRSTGAPNSWKWSFGDGNTSNVTNPVHTYNKTGQFSVSLKTGNANGSNELTKSGFITVTGSPNTPITGFSASPTSGNLPLTVSFTDQSTGSPASWKWTFGDGANSTEKNPVHTFNKSGLFSVTLTENNANGSTALTKTNYIAVSGVSNTPVAEFSASPTSGNTQLSSSFTDLSTGSPASWRWVFGDGTNSTEKNPLHTFNKSGLFSVTLTASNANGSNALTKTSYIAVSGASNSPVMDFFASAISGTVPLTVDFTDRSSGNPISWVWNFGDGNTSKDQNPVHTFNKSGMYSVSLTGINANGSNTLTKSRYITVSSSLVAIFSATPTSGPAPLSVHFTDKSTGSPVSWKWTFGDGNTSNETNPIHVFNKTGQYTVSLTVSNPGGSNTETRSRYLTVTK